MDHPTEPAPTFKFRPQRDGWDMVFFYVGFLCMAPFMGAFQIWSATPTGASRFSWGSLSSIVLALLCSSIQIYYLKNLVRRRNAEEYSLEAGELVIDYGFTKMRIRYADIYAVKQHKISRFLLPFREGVRVKFSNQQSRWRNFEIAPVGVELFFSELSTRCPHLHREGKELFPIEKESARPADYAIPCPGARSVGAG